jgi:hypothetical protein
MINVSCKAGKRDRTRPLFRRRGVPCDITYKLIRQFRSEKDWEFGAQDRQVSTNIEIISVPDERIAESLAVANCGEFRRRRAFHDDLDSQPKSRPCAIRRTIALSGGPPLGKFSSIGRPAAPWCP